MMMVCIILIDDSLQSIGLGTSFLLFFLGGGGGGGGGMSPKLICYMPIDLYYSFTRHHEWSLC